MTKILPNMLNDTLNLVALARETALARGDQARAEKLAPLVDDLRHLVAGVQQPGPSSPAQFTGPLAQDDFQTLLRAAQSVEPSPKGVAAPLERNQVAAAMAAGGMPDVDIARQLGITREEVRMLLSLNQRPQPATGSDLANRIPETALDAASQPAPRPASMPGRRIAGTYSGWQMEVPE
jgi:hypothetical protein